MEKKIAFQGVEGAHSDMACRKNYPEAKTIAFDTFDQVLKAVEEDKADICLIPTENSKAGRVSEIHNLLLETNLYIVGEHFQRIEHFLAAPRGSKLDTLTHVYSHPQALMQCKQFINKNKLIATPYINTAIAARDVEKWNDNTKAAIASKLASEIYNLDILAENVEDDKNNVTLFLAMSKKLLDIDPKEQKTVTSLLFAARNIPASLYKALGGFATNQVNILKIESYIPSGKSKTAEFFISFEGHPHDKNVNRAIEELGFFCKKVKMLGVYPADPKRFNKSNFNL